MCPPSSQCRRLIRPTPACRPRHDTGGVGPGVRDARPSLPGALVRGSLSRYASRRLPRTAGGPRTGSWEGNERLFPLAAPQPRPSVAPILPAGGGIAGLGSTGFALVGCGGGGDDQPPAQTPEEAAEQAAEEAASEEATPETPGEETAEPATPVTPTAGGVARFPTQNDSNNHDRWDPHRSRFSQTQLWHGLMYNRLIRWDSIAAGTLQPDLCNLPEMPDEVTYIFTVRPEARFWDLPPTNGRAFTAQDIRFNIQRQIEGLGADSNPDPLFFRQPDYIRTAAMEVTGDRSIVLSTDGPDSTYLASVHAGPWAWMTSPEAVAEFGADWRNDAGNIQLNSGTGPYVPVSFLGGQNLVLKRSTNWWKPNSAYPDGWIFQHASAADAQQLYLGKQLDLVAAPLGKLAVEALRAEFPVHASFDLPVQTPIQLGFVFTDDPDNPLRDPRLARALSLAVDRFELIDRLYLGDGRLSGPVRGSLGSGPSRRRICSRFPAIAPTRSKTSPTSNSWSMPPAAPPPSRRSASLSPIYSRASSPASPRPSRP